jgi:hypothetical protein
LRGALGLWFHDAAPRSPGHRMKTREDQGRVRQNEKKNTGKKENNKRRQLFGSVSFE